MDIFWSLATASVASLCGVTEKKMSLGGQLLGVIPHSCKLPKSNTVATLANLAMRGEPPDPKRGKREVMNTVLQFDLFTQCLGGPAAQPIMGHGGIGEPRDPLVLHLLRVLILWGPRQMQFLFCDKLNLPFPYGLTGNKNCQSFGP